MVDVHTVSAGGGSIAWVDEGGALRVGPRSAGAEPGPVAYGLGGVEATVTDANLLLGALPEGGQLGGGLVLRRDLSEWSLTRLGERLGLDACSTAIGVVRVADMEMVRALRLISVERGLDPRDFALVAFGGAGGLHACALAEDLGCRNVLVPRAAGVLSAFGLAISEVRHDYGRPLLGDTVEESDLEAGFTALESAAVADLQTPATQRLADLRYAGQSFELTVPGSTTTVLKQAFHAEHERRYGYRIDDEPVEIVNLRLAATVPGAVPDLLEQEARGSGAVVGHRQLLIEGGAADAAVLNRAMMGAGSTVKGPAVVEFPEATCLVRTGWSGVIDQVGTLVLTREPAVGEARL
jgi:N-methylhydantoinase A